MKKNSTLTKRICGAIAAFVAFKFLFDTYTHGYIKSRGGNIITQINDPLSFYSIVIFFIFAGIFCLLFVLGVFKQKPIDYKYPTSESPPVSMHKIEQKLKSIGRTRALFFILYTVFLFLLSTALSIHKFYVFIALIFTLIVVDYLVMPRLFCCPSCKKSIWEYTTRRLKLRKLKMFSKITNCPKCGVLFK